LKHQLEWLKEADAYALQSSLWNLGDAFQHFFQKQNDAPLFKSKRNLLQSYTTKIEKKKQLPEGSIKGNKIKLPKLGWIKFAKSKEVEGRIYCPLFAVHPQENTLFRFFVSGTIVFMFQKKKRKRSKST
jgi:putative transposase